MLFDIRDYCNAVLAFDENVLIDYLNKISSFSFFKSKSTEQFYEKVRNDFWNNSDYSYNEIWNDILRLK